MNALPGSDVVLTIHVKLPGSNIIKVEEVLVDGAGTMTEALQGGQSTIGLTLNAGKELKPLTKNESVFVRGKRGGTLFTLSGALHVVKATRPWELSGKIGSTGP